MASPDFYIYSAMQRLQQINAGRAQALADLEVAKAGADYESAAASVQEIANLDAQRQAIVNLHDQYIRSQQVPEPPELTDEEKHAKPWDKMTWQDGLDLARQSKYGKDLNHDDPAVIAGYAEVMRRRARGE
jgi:hypothetical protein